MGTDEYEGDERPDPDDLTDSGPVEAAERIYRRVRDAVQTADSTEHELGSPPLGGGRWWHRRYQFIFGGAFLVPFVVLGLMGLIAVQMNSDGDESGQADVVPPLAATILPVDDNFTPHTVPAIIRNQLVTLSPQGYQFEGRAGDNWHIVAEALDTLDPQLRLYDPAGTEIALNDDQYAGSLSAEVRVTLPVNGTYRLVVEAAPKSGGSTGSYLLSLFEE